MAKDASFDIVSELNKEEVKNGVQIALKELKNRFDFKGSIFDIKLEGNQLVIKAEDEYKVEQVKDVLFSKLIKRGVPLKNIQFSASEHALGGNARQAAELVNGIDRDSAKKITTAIKNSKIKVKAQIQEDRLRITGKKRDDLQQVIALVKDIELPIDVQFINYR